MSESKFTKEIELVLGQKFKYRQWSGDGKLTKLKKSRSLTP